VPPAKTDPLTSGDHLESRVGQVWFWEGYFARVGIDLIGHYGPDLIQVTDLDLLAIGFGPGLEVHRTIGESKSGVGKSAPKPLDRIVWLRGLQQLVNAHSAELTVMSKATPTIRELGRQLRVNVESADDLTERETALGIADFADAGAHGPDAMILRRTVRSIARDDPTLATAFKFLTSTVWFLDPFAAIKQTLGLLETLCQRWTPGVQDDEMLAMRWLISETLSIWVLNLVTITGHARPMDAAAFTGHVRERLADGIVPAQRMRQLSRDFDKFVGGVLAAANASPELRIEAMGAFNPAPPEWANSLAELALRLARQPALGDLPRQFDLLVHERIARWRIVPKAAATTLRLDDHAVRNDLALIAAFLRSFGSLPEGLSDLIVGGRTPDAREAGSPGVTDSPPSPDEEALFPE
jgi:hypothetical protein